MVDKIIRIFVIEDQPLALKHLVNCLRKFRNIFIMDIARSGEEAMLKIARLDLPPHVVLCDISLPGIDAIKLIEEIKNFDEKIEVVILTTLQDKNRLLEAVQAGACGYLLKETEGDKIYQAVLDVISGGAAIQSIFVRQLLKHFSRPVINYKKDKKIKNLLTPREQECLQAIAHGMSNAEAASSISLSPYTVRTHLEHIYQKLHVSNRVEAIAKGFRHGIIKL